MIDQFYVGVDLGKQQDYTAICVVERKDRIEKLNALEGTYGYSDEPRTINTNYHLRHLERPKLGTSYVHIVQQIKILLSSNLLRNRSILVVDATGVGAPVMDMMVREGLSPIPVVITGGKAIAIHRQGFTVPKRDLVMAMQVVFQSGRLHYSQKNVPLTDLFVRECETFKEKLTRGSEIFEADLNTEHDDIVMSVALAIWYATKDDMHNEVFMPNDGKPTKSEQDTLNYDPLERDGV